MDKGLLVTKCNLCREPFEDAGAYCERCFSERQDEIIKLKEKIRELEQEVEKLTEEKESLETE